MGTLVFPLMLVSPFLALGGGLGWLAFWDDKRSVDDQSGVALIQIKADDMRLKDVRALHGLHMNITDADGSAVLASDGFSDLYGRLEKDPVRLLRLAVEPDTDIEY